MKSKCFRYGFFIFALTVSYTGTARADLLAEAADTTASGIVVACKLPTQVRKIGSDRVFALPGRVQNMTIAQCNERGGRYELRLASENAAKTEDPRFNRAQ